MPFVKNDMPKKISVSMRSFSVSFLKYQWIFFLSVYKNGVRSCLKHVEDIPKLDNSSYYHFLLFFVAICCNDCHSVSILLLLFMSLSLLLSAVSLSSSSSLLLSSLLCYHRRLRWPS